MWDNLRKQIATERECLRRELLDHASLLEKCAVSPPDRVEVSALAMILSAFYSGVENIFERIAIELNEAPPPAHAWHMLLLESMARAGPQRPGVISATLAAQLKKYLQFRHVCRGVYAFQLRWENMAPLVEGCQDVFRQLEAELDLFLAATKDRQ